MVIAATKEEARAAILDGVTRLLARYGYRKMTMDDLAEEVGIGKGTIYLYFPSKEELVLSHIDALVERVCERMREISAEERPVQARLRAMLIARVMVRFDGVYPYRKKLGDNVTDLRGLLLQRRQEHFAKESKVLAEVLREGRKKEALAFQSASRTAMSMIDATNAMLPYSLRAEELEDRAELERRAEAVADLIISGVLA